MNRKYNESMPTQLWEQLIYEVCKHEHGKQLF